MKNKHIADELLEAYREAEATAIYEYRSDISSELETLEKEVASYRKEIEDAEA